MTQDMEANSRSMALALPDAGRFRQDFAAIAQFQQIVHASMVKGHDYGVIPGTGNKPTLLKPGAEKIAKLLGLADEYDILKETEDWDRPLFRYLIRCRLVSVSHGVTISQGLGECNSMEAKYRYRWVGDRDLPPGMDKAKLVSQERRTKTGGRWRVYRVENDDIYSQVNTILKMAKKRALVDAALSAGRLSDLFTQDIEDTATAPDDDPTEDVALGAEKPAPTSTPQKPDTSLVDYRPEEAKRDLQNIANGLQIPDPDKPYTLLGSKLAKAFVDYELGEARPFLRALWGQLPVTNRQAAAVATWLSATLPTRGKAQIKAAIDGILAGEEVGGDAPLTAAQELGLE